MSSKPPSVKGRRLVVLDARDTQGRGAVAAPGVVWLVGAGPGDPELLTVKAVNVLREADLIVHDGLVSDAILDLAPAGARRIGVAKRKSRHSYPQEEINRMLAAFALQGLTVVRLKGGDPFIFGRGGEELEACRAAGVECRVIPGVTAALAAGAAAGAPLTHRGAAQAVTFVTGHARAGEAPDLDWPALARPNQTVVIYMGLANAAAIGARLIAAGRTPETPALIVENASLPTERRLAVVLADLAEAAEGLAGPAILIVGEAMALATSSLPSPSHQNTVVPERRVGKRSDLSGTQGGVAGAGGDGLAEPPGSRISAPLRSAACGMRVVDGIEGAADAPSFKRAKR